MIHTVYSLYYDALGVDGWKNMEEHQGSGHLGPSFVGVASVLEGRGLMQLSSQAVMAKKP